MFLEILLLVGIIAYGFYRWAIHNNDFFAKRGIPFDEPRFLFGSMRDVVLRQKPMLDVVKGIYDRHDGKYYGFFDQRTPILMIRDPEMIKQITIKDFDHFVNHRPVFGDSEKDLFVNSIFFIRDNKWKDMRTTLSPAFTGSKMRHMFDLMNQVACNFSIFLKDMEKADTGIELDVKDFTTRFTSDMIASTAFGLQVNSFKEKDNQFYMMGRQVTQFTNWQNLKFFLYGNFKSIMKLFKLEIIEKEETNYFMRLVLDAIRYRQEHKIVRPDMINMLMEARNSSNSDHSKQNNREWSDVDIVAQCFLFFFAGFEAVSVLMCFAAHELMENPETQAKLYEEIRNACEDLDGKSLTYEILQGMKYLDMIISETLRKWPGALAADRVASKDYVCEFDNGERVEIKKDEFIWIPIVGLHRDPKYFPDPEKFDPERFSDENKDSIVPYSYLPFGAGPRNCIGSRLALLEAKAMIFYMVRDFQILPGKRTCVPMKLSSSNFQLTPEGGFWLKFVPRVKG